MVPNSTRWTGPWLGATRASALQRVANRALISHVLDGLLDSGVDEAVVVAPADVAEQVAACVSREGPAGLAVRHLVRYQVADRAEALQEVMDFVGPAPCVLHRADGLLGQPLHSLVPDDGEPADGLLLVGDRDSNRLRLVPRGPAEEERPGAAPLELEVAGVCVLRAHVLGRLPNPERCEQLLDFTAITEQLARDGSRIDVRVARKWRSFGGDARDLLELNRTTLDLLDAEITARNSDGNRFEGHVAIHPTARVTDSVIIGPAVIGADALIHQSYIGPHTAIGDRVHIAGSEVERSIVHDDASLLYVGGRVVASIVGREARVFRDFSMPRALRLQVGDGDEVALC